ncbi:MAG: hypothetical protein M1839_005380 [Geoglossum umbratile]|nr:MAG: hypothetical protein M1839_005380 [Geoglossum umbratile]
MDVDAPRTRTTGLGTVTQYSNHPTAKLLEGYLRSVGVTTYVSTDPKITALLGYSWDCEPGVKIPKTNPARWSAGQTRAVKNALKRGKIKAYVGPALRLDMKRTPFAEKLRHDREIGYENCVYLMRPSKKRRTIPSSQQSANSTSPAFRFHTDSSSIDVDGSGDHGPLLDTSGDSATVTHAHLRRERSQDEDTDGTQLVGDDSFSEELPGAYVSHDPAPIPHGSSVSRLTLPEPWATRVKSVEDKAHDSKRKGATVICFTRTGTGLTLDLFRSLLTCHEEPGRKIVDAFLSMLLRPMDRLEARQTTVIFESTFWQTYRRRQGHLGRWYDMVAPLGGMEMLLFPVFQDGHWTLFEVSGVEKMIRHYAPVDLDSTDLINTVIQCLETEFETGGWTDHRRPLPRGNSGVLMLATAAQRVLRRDVEYSQEDIPELCRWLTAILLGMKCLTIDGLVHIKMVGVSYRSLEQIDIFGLLGLDPNRDYDVIQLKNAYRRAMLVNHPDKAAANPNRAGDNAKVIQLNDLKEFLCNFDPDSPHIWRRVAELFRRGKDGRASSSRGRGHVPRPTSASTLAKPGSSPSNPIVIDAPGIGAPASLPVGPPNRKGKTRARTKLRRQRRSRRSSYHPSRASEWRPAPYADQSDSDLGWD